MFTAWPGTARCFSAAGAPRPRPQTPLQPSRPPAPPAATPSCRPQVIKGPVAKYLPPGARRVGFSHSSDTLVTMSDWARRLSDDDLKSPIVFVVGGFAHGVIDNSYVDEFLSVSQFPLSAAYALSRITNAMEARWGVV